MDITQQTGIEVVVNGEPRAVPEGSSLLSLVGQLGLEPERLAVELDGRIVKRARWSETALRAGARLEIVQFVGGG